MYIYQLESLSIPCYALTLLDIYITEGSRSRANKLATRDTGGVALRRHDTELLHISDLTRSTVWVQPIRATLVLLDTVSRILVLPHPPVPIHLTMMKPKGRFCGRNIDISAWITPDTVVSRCV
jgi:hypothetical protein